MIGQTVSHYKILEKLGEGGMGVVYKAQDTKLDRLVALKFLPAEAVADEETHERFYAEAKAAAALDHPNIATIHEVNDVDDQMYIAMAYIDGEGIDHRVAGGPLAIEDAVDYATQAAEGLAAAHAKGVVHRDIKSANIMIKQDGRVVILDFGLATRHGAGESGTESTSGTMAYMAPEQAKGEVADHRADIWALGVTLFEMLTGRLPFAGEYGEALMYSIVNADAPDVVTLRRDVPESLQNVVAKALTKNPDERYASATELIADLKTVAHEMGGGAQPAGRRRTIDFRSLAAWIGGTLAAIYLTFTIVGMLTRDGEASDVPAVAVFPFENTRSTAEFDWLSQEIARTLTFKLGQLSNIQVVDQLQIKTALDRLGVNETNLSVEALSRQGSQELGADLGLVGSFTTYGDSMRVLASLVDLDSRVVTPLVEEIYSTSDLLGMQSQVAAKITERMTAMNPEPTEE